MKQVVKDDAVFHALIKETLFDTLNLVNSSQAREWLTNGSVKGP